MCVQTKNLSWERPAEITDIAAIEKSFAVPGLNEAFAKMSENGFQPLTADLTLLAAVCASTPDENGVRYVPFSALHMSTGTVVKLPVMDQIGEWFENTALGTDMWNAASDWAEERFGARFHFLMNCGCGLVPLSAGANGTWSVWLQRFNASRSEIVGRTNVIRRDRNTVRGLDISSEQLMVWQRIRKTLERLPEMKTQKLLKAA